MPHPGSARCPQAGLSPSRAARKWTPCRWRRRAAAASESRFQAGRRRLFRSTWTVPKAAPGTV
ncbi:MAG: hypothetical protein ACK55Z_37925, partial [bacterium]